MAVETLRGHSYLLANNQDDGGQALDFYMDPKIHAGKRQRGTTSQEALRAVIMRTIALDEELGWGGNDAILAHLREALFLYEVRAAARHGLCMLASWTRLREMARAYEGAIELIQPRRADSHIYDEAVHLAADCGGRCE